MPSLPQATLLAKLRAALPAGSTFLNEDVHPAVVTIPDLGICRLYLWTITHVESPDRPQDEFKIQLILPGQERGTTGELNVSGDAHTFLLGYSPDYGVFAGWEARLHSNFSFSKAVQVKEQTLHEAHMFGWAVASPRRLRNGADEVRVAFSPQNLLHYLKASIKHAVLSGLSREAALLADAPLFGKSNIVIPTGAEKLKALSRQLRRTQIARRWERDAKFSPAVKQQYKYSCAICGVQLDVVEAAHIVPVHDEISCDEAWNGLALCANHHRLFDAHTIVVERNLTILVDDVILEYLKASNRDFGVKTILDPFRGKTIREPQSFRTDSVFRANMEQALDTRRRSTAIDE